MKLECREYVVTDHRGMIIEIKCKGCGTTIAKTNKRGFLEHGLNYAELKMRFSDGNSHITNVCHQCLREKGRSQSFMLALFKADVEQMERELPQADFSHLKVQTRPKFKAAETKRRPLI